MYKMPRSFPLSKRWLAAVSAFALLIVVFLAGVDADAQRRKRPVKPKPQDAANANTQTAQQKPQRKNITPLRSSDTSEGSRITITSDAPLNDYSAYRSGDRYYVLIPEANAPRAQSGLRGRGFEDVQVQKRGNDAILSFKLQPGTNARVSQRFNRLDVELTTPGGKTATATPETTPTPQATPQATPVTPVAVETSTPQPVKPGTTNPLVTPSPTTAETTVTSVPPPDQSASPTVSPEASPVASPPAEQIAQVQTPPASQPVTTNAPATSSTSLGTMLRQNWLVILIAALVLLSLVMLVAARSRAQRAETAVSRPSRKEKRAARKASAELAEADTSSSVSAAAASESTVVSKARVVKTAPVVAAVGAAELVKEEEKPAPTVDAERVEIEVGKVLAGESYDESLIGASDAGTRQLVATELLSALASRNVERRERAREAFIKHDYLDEATRNLRTADAPAERAAAARSLGYVQEKSVTPHLVAALEDDAPEVRRAAVESLVEVQDPAAIEPLKRLLKRERDRKVPRPLIQRAIEISVAVEEEETATLTAATPVPEAEAAIEASPVIAEAETPTLETETPTLETEAPVETQQPTAALSSISSTEAAPELIVAAAPLVTEEVDAEAEEAARREAEEEAARLRAEEEERQRVAAEARRQAEEEEAARLKAEEEERLRAEAEAQRKAEEEAARLRAEEEARQYAEQEEARRRAEEERQRLEERLRLEEEARQRAEAAAARLRAEEERRRAEQERLRAEEEARLAAEAEAQRRIEEEAARLRAEEEERERAEAEAQRKAEEEARRLAEEEAAAMLNAEAVSPGEAELIEETATPAASQLVLPVEPLIERADATPAGWVDVNVSEPQPSSLTEEAAASLEPTLETAEAGVRESKEIEPAGFSIIAAEPAARPVSKEIDHAVTEKGLAEFDEFSTVPGVILKRLSSEEPGERAAAVTDLARVGGDDSFREISAAFDDPAVEVRNAAARSLFSFNQDRAATFTRALRESPPERRRKIGSALASSGLASEAIGQLMGESREKTYDAFSLLFLMSKAGEVQPLMRAIEEHPNNEVRLAVVKLLALSGQQEILPAFRRLAVRGSLPTEVRSAVMEAIYQISSQSPTPA